MCVCLSLIIESRVEGEEEEEGEKEEEGGGDRGLAQDVRTAAASACVIITVSPYPRLSRPPSIEIYYIARPEESALGGYRRRRHRRRRTKEAKKGKLL